MQTQTQTEANYPIFRILEFPYPAADHINWDSIAKLARSAGANFRAEWSDSGCTVTIEWPPSEE